MAGAQPLLDVLEPICARRGGTVEIDLSEVDFVDSTGLNAFVRLHRISDAATGTLVIAHPHTRVRRLFDITGLGGMIQVV